MDPDAAYEDLIQLATDIVSDDDADDDMRTFAWRVLDLDRWIKRGGFLPAAWQRK